MMMIADEEKPVHLRTRLRCFDIDDAAAGVRDASSLILGAHG